MPTPLVPLADVIHPSSGVMVIVAVVAGWWFLARRSRRRRHDVAWAAATVLFVGAAVGPLDWLGERRLLSAHMIQHLVLMSAVPALVLLALPTFFARVRLTGTAAAACLVLGVGAIWFLHLPAVLDAGIDRPWLHDAQHLGMAGAGLLLAVPLSPAGARLGFGAAFYLVAAELSVGALGIWLAWSPQLVYDSYAGTEGFWGLSPETDQALAGALLLVVEEPFLAVEFAIVFIAALGSQAGDNDHYGA